MVVANGSVYVICCTVHGCLFYYSIVMGDIERVVFFKILHILLWVSIHILVIDLHFGQYQRYRPALKSTTCRFFFFSLFRKSKMIS